MKPRYQNLLLASASVLAALVAAELVLRIAVPDRLDRWYFVWPPGLEAEFTPISELTPGITGTSRFSINESGVRGDPLSSDHALRILTFGGSTTECLYLDQTESWPYLLQRRLNADLGRSDIWVGNVGKSGHHTRDHMLQVEKLLDQLAGIDLVILMVGMNDLMLRLGEDSEWRPLSAQPPAYEDRLLRHAFTVFPRTGTDLPFYKRTEIWRLLRLIKHGPMWSSRQADRPFFQDSEGAFYAPAREHRRNALQIRESLPDLASALREYVDNIRDIVESTQRMGAGIVLLTQPALYRLDLPPELEELLWFGIVGEFREEGNEYYSVGALSEGIAMYNRAVLELCEADDLHCIDVASMLPKDTTVLYDDVHFNEAGARRVADIVSANLIEAGTLDSLD